MSTINLSRKAGSISEAGMIRNFTSRMGFTPTKCGSELIANSCDAQSTQILFKEDHKTIKMIDNGIGMDEYILENMFSLFNENNSERQSMGVSGIGGKAASFILSKKEDGTPTTVIVYSKKANGRCIKAVVPWGEIISQSKWSEMIDILDATEEEIAEFNGDRTLDDIPQGTTIVWEYSDALRNLLRSQFIKSEKDKIVKINTRWDIIFGSICIDIKFLQSDGSPQLILPKYNYFGDNQTFYYDGKHINTIMQYVDLEKKDRFIWHDDDTGIDKEITRTEKTIKVRPLPVVIHSKWELIGEINVINGMRKDPRIFDEKSADPHILDNAQFELSPYDKNFFSIGSTGEILKEFLPRPKLNRNGQNISDFELEGYKGSLSRANAAKMIECFCHRTEVHYSTYSTQNNRTDCAFGIEANKNKNENDFPPELTRLIKYFKDESIVKIRAHWQRVITEKKRIAKEIADAKIKAEKIAIEAKAAALAAEKIASMAAQIQTVDDDEDEEDSDDDSDDDNDSDSDDEDDDEDDDDNENKSIEQATCENKVNLTPLPVETANIIINTQDEEPIIVPLEPQINKHNLIQLIQQLTDETDGDKIKSIYDFAMTLSCK